MKLSHCDEVFRLKAFPFLSSDVCWTLDSAVMKYRIYSRGLFKKFSDGLNNTQYMPDKCYQTLPSWT
jgi:hypothetical protein